MASIEAISFDTPLRVLRLELKGHVHECLCLAHRVAQEVLGDNPWWFFSVKAELDATAIHGSDMTVRVIVPKPVFR